MLVSTYCGLSEVIEAKKKGTTTEKGGQLSLGRNCWKVAGSNPELAKIYISEYLSKSAFSELSCLKSPSITSVIRKICT